MRILIIGAGGIGSWLIPEIVRLVQYGQLIPDKFAVADEDIVEPKQLAYQNFEVSNVGLNKAESLATCNIITAIPKKITKTAQLEDYDTFVLCVDNDVARKLVVEYCHATDKQFIDLRATGRRVFAMTKQEDIKDNLKFIDGADIKTYSCQDAEDLKRLQYQYGHRIVAMIGVQLLLNMERGKYVKDVISMVI